MATAPERSFSPREETFTSPYSVSPTREEAAAWPQAQYDLVMSAFKRFMNDPFERNVDLRGRYYQVYVHEDGLNVTIREV